MVKTIKKKEEQKLVQLKGKVSRIIYTSKSSSPFTVGKIYVEDKDLDLNLFWDNTIVFSGKISVCLDERVVLTGYYTTHPKYGKQFQVESYRFDQSLDKEGLVKLLAENKILIGLGPKKAQKIVDALGDDFENILENNLDRFIKISRVKPEIAKKFQEDWLKKKQYSNTLAQLLGRGIAHNAANKLMDKYGNNVIALLKQNPYTLINDIPSFGFKRVDEIARKSGTAKDNPERIKACLVYLLEENEDQGHCYIAREELIYKANKDLILDTLNSKEIIADCLDELIRMKVLYQTIYNNERMVSKYSTYNEENFLYTSFTTKLANNPHFAKVPDGIFDVAPFAGLNEKQRLAIELFCNYNQCVIAGIAGSGKSYLINAILKLCNRNNLNVVLTSFTGHACKVIQEITGQYAITIHRLLGYKGEKFTFDNPLLFNADVIIIDEVGLIDIKLLYNFYSRLDFSKQVVVLVGDYKQLSPIGIGNVLRDLTTFDILPKVILTECVRQAGELRRNCNAILDGKVADTSETFLGESTRKAWYKITNFTKPEDIQKYILQIYQGSLREKLNFDLLKDIQLLSPTKKGILGTKELNKLLQKTIQEKVNNVDFITDQRFYPKDKVIQTVNNYDIDVMNGTVGYIHAFDKNNHFWVDYDEKIVEYKDDMCFEIDLAYCMTCHKYQGSQIPCVIFLCSKLHSWMHSRALLYTASTRATVTNIIIGDAWAINNCVNRDEADKRRTFLEIFYEINKSEA